MVLKHVLLFSVALGVFSGCSDRIDASSDLKKKERKIIEYCNGEMRCVCDSIPDIRSYRYKGEVISCNHNMTFDNNQVQGILNEEKKSVQETFDKQAQCLKSQKVDILKDSIRFKFVFDSCWTEYMQRTNNH